MPQPGIQSNSKNLHQVTTYFIHTGLHSRPTNNERNTTVGDDDDDDDDDDDLCCMDMVTLTWTTEANSEKICMTFVQQSMSTRVSHDTTS